MKLMHKLLDVAWKIGSNPIAFVRYAIHCVKQYRTNDLLRFANKVKTDKGISGHNYVRVYDYLLKVRRSEELTLCEIGLLRNKYQASSVQDRNRMGRGEDSNPTAPSLRMWRDYLPNATIIGFDISTFQQPEDKKCFIVQGDQSSRNDLKKILDIEKELDVVIDDALHASPHQQITLSYLFPHVTSGGLYFIEDLHSQPEDFKYPDVPRTIGLLKELAETGQWRSPLATPQEKAVLESQVKEIHFFDSLKLTDPRQKTDALALIVKK